MPACQPRCASSLTSRGWSWESSCDGLFLTMPGSTPSLTAMALLVVPGSIPKSMIWRVMGWWEVIPLETGSVRNLVGTCCRMSVASRAGVSAPGGAEPSRRHEKPPLREPPRCTPSARSSLSSSSHRTPCRPAPVLKGSAPGAPRGAGSRDTSGLILESQRRGESDRTGELLLEGLASGPGGSFDARWVEQMSPRVAVFD